MLINIQKNQEWYFSRRILKDWQQTTAATDNTAEVQQHITSRHRQTLLSHAGMAEANDGAEANNGTMINNKRLL